MGITLSWKVLSSFAFMPLAERDELDVFVSQQSDKCDCSQELILY